MTVFINGQEVVDNLPSFTGHYEVADRLFVGPVPINDAHPRFKRIVNLYPFHVHSPDARYKTAPDVITLSAPLLDAHAVPPRDALYSIVDVLNRWRDEGHDVFVHCQAGLNRSGLVCALALMRGDGFSGDEAVAAVRLARGPWALCNPIFVEFLTNGG